MILDLLLMSQNEALRKALGGRIKALRKQKRWSQKELAGKLGLRFQQLNKYESGLNVPPVDMLIALADALEVTTDYLLTGNPVEDSPLSNSRLFRRFKELEQFSQDDQETVIKVIDAMIAKHRIESTLKSMEDDSETE